jgi:decaprenylphospho-beta-D-erythro-pentofuranosid-2-ulose 2-reductase
MSLPTYRHAIVVGASSGIGAELVRLLAASGCRVAAVARRLPRLEALAAEFPGLVFPIAHDVLDIGDIAATFQDATEKLGGLDLVVYASGIMPEVSPSEYNFDKDRDMVLTNFLGGIGWLNQAAIRFEKVGRGTILAIGSVAGDRGRAGQPVYNASKGALAIYVEALRNRLSAKGVRVVTVKPGPVETEMTANLGLKNAMPVKDAAAKTLKLSGRSGEHYLKITHRVIFAIIRLIPSGIFRRLKL